MASKRIAKLLAFLPVGAAATLTSDGVESRPSGSAEMTIETTVHGAHQRRLEEELAGKHAPIEMGVAFHVIGAGAAEMATDRGNGEERLSNIGPGAVSGEMALFENQLRSATATALQDTELCRDHTVGLTG